jgi:hypothetical protein
MAPRKYNALNWKVLIENGPQVLMFLQLYEAIRILEFLSLFFNNGFCLFVVDCALLKKECDSYSETFCVGSQTKF